jgi:DNA modification methylase
VIPLDALDADQIADVADAPPPPIAPGTARVDLGSALDLYKTWPKPTVIMSDGAYGVSGFPGDPPTPRDLGAWYEPHIEAWAKFALPSTTLWFWNTEVGWANVHPVLEKHGWVYRACHTWDKGIAHVAGNVNGNTIRRFPIVTEVCAQYVRDVRLASAGGEELSLKVWLRTEWQRSGLILNRTNEAAGVKNAATRKYFTQDHLWYFPPPAMIERLAAYATEHGKPTDWPYFSIDGKKAITAAEWDLLRAKWHHVHGITNVWSEPANRGAERVRDGDGQVVHANQKPLRLMDMTINAASDPGDVVWEPFGGLCSAVLSAGLLGRHGYAAEILPDFHEVAAMRVAAAMDHASDQDEAA